MPGYNRLTRRQVLLGTGGFMLGLPLLQSLLEKNAYAGTPTIKRNLAVFRCDHGGAASASMYPALPPGPAAGPGIACTQPGMLCTQNYYAPLGHSIRQTPLTFSSTANGVNVISPIVSGPASPSSNSSLFNFTGPGALTTTIMQKMNLIHGLDAGVAIGHNYAGILGCYGGPETPYNLNLTLDQVIASSKSFQAQGATVVPAINYGGGLSFQYTNQSTQSGPLIGSPSNFSSLYWFESIFAVKASGEAGAPPLSVVDRVYQDYKRLLNGRRISSSDKQVVEAHLANLQKLQQQLLQQAASVASCGRPTKPDADSTYPNGDAAVAYYLDPYLQIRESQLQNDVIVAAMQCGATQIGLNGFAIPDNATIHSSNYQYSASDPQAQGLYDWHHGVAHCHMYTEQQQELVTAYNYSFQVMLDLICKMDALQVAPETEYPTLLDNSLVYWSMECGEYTHSSVSWPVVMAGSAGGSLLTGNYLDYRNNTAAGVDDNGEGTEVGDVSYKGIPYNQWLGTVAQAMGLQQSEYETKLPDGTWIGGYGPIQGQVADGGSIAMGAFDQSVYTAIHNAGGWLPFIAGPTAG